MPFYTKHIALVAALFFAIHSSATAGEPVYDRDFPLHDQTHQWRVEMHEHAMTLIIAEIDNPKTATRYDLSDCNFCSGEEDNCAQDGIFPIRYGAGGQQAALGVMCHVGAHSQRFRILLPQQQDGAAVFEVTGKYFATAQVFHGGVAVHYDTQDEQQVVRIWPENALSNAPVGTRKRAK